MSEPVKWRVKYEFRGRRRLIDFGLKSKAIEEAKDIAESKNKPYCNIVVVPVYETEGEPIWIE